MNEELKIVIKAITDEAKKELEKVKKELEDVKKKSEEASKASENIKKIGIAAVAVVGSIVALTAAMTNLGKSAMELQKAQAKLNTSFQSMGSNAAQAQKTYSELYRFLGDVDTATEAAQSLALITTNEKDLAEWTTILQGAYASMGDKLPTEGLAEAANETIKVGQVTGNLADALNWLGVSEDAVNESLANMNSQSEREAYLRSMLVGLYQGSADLYERNNAQIIAQNESQNRLNMAIASTSAYTVPLITALNNLGAMLLEYLGPALRVVCAILITFIQWIGAAAKAVGSFFGAFKDEGSEAGNTVTTTIKGTDTQVKNLGSDFKKTTNEATKLKKQLMGFDELNVVSPPTATAPASGGGVGGGGGVAIPGVEIPEIEMPPLGLDSFNETLEEVSKRLEGVLVLAGIVGAAFAAWGITHLIKNFDALKGKIKDISGTIMIVAGALLLVQGYSDAWANGIDWGNFATTLAGIGLVVGGITLKFGPLAGAISLIVGGIAMLVLGIKDLVTNGYSMEAVIMVAVGAITILIGVVWAFNAALLASPLTWIVVAIMAVVAVFVILWNECDAFRQFWIDLWDGIVVAFEAVVAWFKQAGKDIAKFFVDAWNAIKGAWNAVVNFFKGIWDGIVNIFKGVGNWFGNLFKNAWNGIKSAWSGVVGFFKGIWDSITSIFKSVGTAISNAITGSVKSAINGVLSGAIGIINGFISAINLAIAVINLIPGVNISKLKKLDVPKLAKGGIVDSATLAVVGERGKEAVVPLENNTEWMDKLADRIAQRNNTPSRIVLMVDGRELGWASINSINDITHQTGGLQLSLV